MIACCSCCHCSGSCSCPIPPRCQPCLQSIGLGFCSESPVGFFHGLRWHRSRRFHSCLLVSAEFRLLRDCVSFYEFLLCVARGQGQTICSPCCQARLHPTPSQKAVFPSSLSSCAASFSHHRRSQTPCSAWHSGACATASSGCLQSPHLHRRHCHRGFRYQGSPGAWIY